VGRTADGRTAGDGPGSGDDVAAWLADDGAGTVLHAACHGTVEVGTGSADTSYLLLAGGSRFAAEDLIRTAARRRTRGIALAVLAACSSGVPGRGYDEAFSIATAFLTAGTRTVVSALWKVPDTTGTSVLMFLFHHLLRTRGPADALRDAQLWMLDPGRDVPDEMPASLRAGLDEPADVAAWAGFTHTGR
jgi:CHAT domain-containing protein